MVKFVLMLALVGGLTSCHYLKQNTSVDVGTDVQFGGFFPSAGASVSAGPCALSVGAWSDLQGSYGPYQSLGCSFTPFASSEKKDKKKAEIVAKSDDFAVLDCKEPGSDDWRLKGNTYMVVRRSEFGKVTVVRTTDTRPTNLEKGEIFVKVYVGVPASMFKEDK